MSKTNNSNANNRDKKTLIKRVFCRRKENFSSIYIAENLVVTGTFITHTASPIYIIVLRA